MGTLNPLQVFPLEIWKIIFETFEGEQGCSKNLLNCSRVCTTFQNVLKPKECQWIYESIFHLIFPYLKEKHILRCRRVCKEWCRVVDTFLEDFESRRPFDEETSNVSRLMSKWHSKYRDPLTKIKWIRLRDTTEVSKFMSVMKPEGRNLFVGSSLILEDSEGVMSSDHEDDDDEQPVPNPRRDRSGFWNKASELVLMFGDHIKFIELNPSYHYMNAKEFYKVLRQCLSSLSNLRSLTISGGLDFFDDDDGELADLGPRDRLRLLQKFLDEDSSSLVEIHSLESLVLQVRHLPQAICEKLIAQINPRKLKTLIFHVWPHIFEEESMIKIPEPISSLTELHLNNIRSLDYLKHWFVKIVQGASLGKLVLQFCPSAVKTINFDLVCDAINKYGPTLKMLAITANLIDIEQVHGLPIPSLNKLETPHLRSLEVHGLIFRRGFLPKSCAQSLEYLHISLPFTDHSTLKVRKMKFYKRVTEGELCYLRAWNEMPNLNVVNVYLGPEKFSCSREQHLEACEELD